MKAKTRDRAQLDLFAPPPAPPAPVVEPEPSAPRAWREVKQEVFLSWSLELQLRYCAKRDFDSSVLAEEDGNATEAEWFEERGTNYVLDAERLSRASGASAEGLAPAR